MEIAIIIISSLLAAGLIAFIVLFILHRRKYKEAKKVEENKPKPAPKKEKPVKVELTPEQKEEKKKKEHSSKVSRLSEMGLRRSNEFNTEEDSSGVEVVGIVYNEKSRMYLFNPKEFKLNAGDVVIVLDQTNVKRTVPVVMGNKKVNEGIIVQPFKDILEVVYQTNEKASDYKTEEVKPVEEEAKPAKASQEEETEPVEENVEETPVDEPLEEVQEEQPVEEAPADEPQEEVVEEAPAEEPAEEPTEEPQEEVVEEVPAEESQEEEKTEKPAEEPQEEVQEEKEPEPEPEPEAEAEPVAEEPADEKDDDTDDSEDEAEESDDESTDDSSQQATGNVSVEFDAATKQYRVIRIKRTYECKLSTLQDDVKEYYDNVRNKLLSYKVKYSKTKTSEKFRFNKENIAILKVVGKQVGLYLALDPKELENSKYKGKDLSEKKSYSATPFQYKFKTNRKAVWAIELVEMLANKYNLELNEKHKDEEFAKAFPQMTEEELIAKGYMTKTETITNEPPKGFVKVVEEK